MGFASKEKVDSGSRGRHTDEIMLACIGSCLSCDEHMKYDTKKLSAFVHVWNFVL